MKKLLFLFLLINISCSNLTRNKLYENEFRFREGRSGQKVWDDDLVFKRYSWYVDMTLLYDVLYTKIDSSSPFYSWFSDSEKTDLKQCSHAFVAMAYQLDDQRLSHTQFKENFRKQNFEQILVPTFKNNLRIHPDFQRYSFHLYDVYVLCAPKPIHKSISVSFPNFREVVIQ